MAERPHVIVIGGTRGIGRAFVRAAAEAGSQVSIFARGHPVSELPSTRTWTVDVCDHDRLRTGLGEAVQQHGKARSLVFFQRYRGQGDDWEGELGTTLTATKVVVEDMLERDRFDRSPERGIVMVGSAASRLIADEQPLSYHVAKAALRQMVRYYAVMLGPRGIRVNSVSPGSVLKDESQDFYATNAELRRVYEHAIPLARMGTADDVAQAIIFLCSSAASFITGQELAVDGGVSLRWQESLARRAASLHDVSVIRP